MDQALEAYFNKRILKNLPSPISGSASPDNFKDHFALIQERDRQDAEWARQAREKEEKWGMYLASMAKGVEALEVARRRQEGQDGEGSAVKELVDGSADVLGPYLGETVSCSFHSAKYSPVFTADIGSKEKQLKTLSKCLEI